MLNDCKSNRNKALRLSVFNHDEAETKVYNDYEIFFDLNDVSWKTPGKMLVKLSLFLNPGIS